MVKQCYLDSPSYGSCCCLQKLQEEVNQAEQVALCLDVQISKDGEAVQRLADMSRRCVCVCVCLSVCLCVCVCGLFNF